MELMTDLVNNQLTLYIPVAIVLIGAILLFTFGFKSAEQPPFDKLSSGAIDDRKTANKKRKIKEKKTTANGHVVSESKNEKSTPKERETKKSPSKEVADSPKLQKEKKQEAGSPKQSEKVKKVDTPKVRKVDDEGRSKKNVKSKSDEKPVDYDDGNWETVPTKNDKKKKQQESPIKKDKKPIKKADKPVEIEKLVKEEINKQLQENVEKETKAEVVVESEPVKNVEIEQIVTVEVKKEKSEKKPKKENIEIIEEPKIISEETASEEHEEVVEVSENQSASPSKAAPGGVVFDELGDVWTEAKAAKKSKKKARRDN